MIPVGRSCPSLQQQMRLITPLLSLAASYIIHSCSADAEGVPIQLVKGDGGMTAAAPAAFTLWAPTEALAHALTTLDPLYMLLEMRGECVGCG